MTQPPEPTQTLDLSELQYGLPAITPAFGAALAEACAICLTDQDHQLGTELQVKGDFTEVFVLLWPKVTDQMRRCWNDEEYTTEQAAYGIALMLTQQLTEFTVVERSRRGTGFDYWLGSPPESAERPFQKSIRLEVSGIRQGNQRQIRSRVKLKMEQVKPTDELAPAYIAVIEFSQPIAWIVER
ncbi:MAG: hypothetical protein F6K19_27800 [Cyanothece sp. SIO1E1]|nr:hypothetical protein [Cyanothece sp. SIO1E1]